MSFTTPDVQVRMYFDERDRQYEARQREHRKAQADRIFNDPLTLALLVSDAIHEDPFKFGMALQELRDGDALTFSLLATSAVFESVK